MTDWRLIYGDLSVVSSEDMAWEKAPGWDVQIGLFRDPAQGGLWTIRHGGLGETVGDFFRLDGDGSIVGMDIAGFIGHVVNDLGLTEPGAPLEVMIWRAVKVAGSVKQGKMLSSAKWQAVLRYGMQLRNELRGKDGRGS